MRPINATLTRLQLHDVIMLDGRMHRVNLINDCRARCIPVTGKLRTFVPATGEKAGQTVTIKDPGNPISISPNAESEIIGKWIPESQTVRLAGATGSAGIPAGEVPPDPDPLEQQSLL